MLSKKTDTAPQSPSFRYKKFHDKTIIAISEPVSDLINDNTKISIDLAAQSAINFFTAIHPKTLVKEPQAIIKSFSYYLSERKDNMASVLATKTEALDSNLTIYFFANGFSCVFNITQTGPEYKIYVATKEE